MNIAKTIRIRKERELRMPLGAPRTYCRDSRCMFRIWKREGYVKCPAHPDLNPECLSSEAKREEGLAVGPGKSEPAMASVAERKCEGIGGSTASLPDSRPHSKGCSCPKCVFPF